MGSGLGLPCRSWKGLAICIRSSISLSCRRLAAAVSIIIPSALIAPPTAREMLRACIAARVGLGLGLGLGCGVRVRVRLAHRKP